MNSQPTHEDANLILRLYELRREEKLRQAREWYTQSYRPVSTVEEHMAQCPPGSQNNAYFRMVTSYWDMTSSFVTSGVLNQNLFLDSAGELRFVWTKAKDIVPAIRAALSNPRYLSNLEKIGNAAIERMNQADPKAYSSFVERVVKGWAQTATQAQG